MIKERRNVGVEVEISGPGSKEWWAHEVSKIAHKADAVLYNDYSDRHGVMNATDFHLTYDGSVSGCGLELLTRPFQIQDKNFVKKFKKILVEIRKSGGEIDLTCGLHIHISGHDFTLMHVKNLIKYYIKWEGVLQSLVHKSRRKNTFCSKIGPRVSIDKLKVIQKMSHLDSMLWHKVSRGSILNLKRFFKEKHYEVRLCHGMLNPQRILNWIALHLHIAQFVKNSTEEFPDEYANAKRASLSAIDEMMKELDFEKAVDYFQTEYRKFRGGN